jgi:acetyl-CoA C-acetyltransferase
MADPIVILGGARTAFGSFNGALASQSATVLGGHAIASALVKSGVTASDVDDVVMGVVLPAGMGQAPARQAAAKAGIPWSANCVTVNKMCGSGMQAIIQAHDAVSLGTSNVVIAGGMESMTNAPHLLRMRENPSLRNVTKPNAVKAEDHLLLDGLCDSFGSDARLMGHFAEATAERYQFSRQEQDAFAIASLTRAQQAAEGFLQDEITPVTIATRKGYRKNSDVAPGLHKRRQRDSGKLQLDFRRRRGRGHNVAPPRREAGRRPAGSYRGAYEFFPRA